MIPVNARLVCASHSPLLYCYAKAPDDWDALQLAMRTAADTVSNFEPDLVIAFGSDHFNGFFLNNMPAFSVGLEARAEEDIGGTPGALDVPTDAAVQCVEFLRAHDVDAGVSERMTVDHAFSQTIDKITGGLSAYPVIPIFINCINPPFVPFRRSRMLGESIGAFASKLGGKVLFLASGGMSHHPTRYYPEPGEGPDEVEAWKRSGGQEDASLSRREWLKRLEVMHHEGAQMIVDGKRTPADMRLNPEIDARFLEVLKSGRIEAFDDWKPDEVIAEGGIGFMELHTWIAAYSAQRSAGGGTALETFYSVTPELGIATGIVRSG